MHLNSFKEQWNSLFTYIESQMIKSVADSGRVDYEDIARLYRNEILRWNMEDQYQAEWLDSLRNSNPEVAGRFEEELNAFRFVPVDSKSKVPFALYVGGTTAAGAGVGYGITKLIGLGGILIAVGTAAIGVVGLEVGKTISDKLKKDAADKICNEYKLQLQAEGEKLAEIVKLADK